MIHNVPGVGENLQDHHEVPVVAATTAIFGYYGEDKGWRALRNGLQYLLFRSGPVASVGSRSLRYVDPEGGERPTLKMYCVPTVYLDADVKDVQKQDGVTVNACLLRPKSRGTVRLRSADPFAKPVVDNNYLAEPDDLRLEIQGLRFAREILAQKPLSSRITHELLPGKDKTKRYRPCRALPPFGQNQLASRRHLPHGPRWRLDGRSRPTASRPRHRRASRHRCLRHALRSSGNTNAPTWPSPTAPWPFSEDKS